MTSKIQKYFSNVFISVVLKDKQWVVYSKVMKKSKITEKFSKSFETSQDNLLPKKMVAYLESLQEEYYFAYIALFLDSMGQGAIPGTKALDFEKNSVDMKHVTHFSIDKTWSVYASFIDINWSKKLFVDTGIDFIYSPFVVLHRLLSAHKLHDTPTLFLLNHHESLSVAIFSGSRLLFGAFFRTNTDEQLSESIGGDDNEEWEHIEEEQDVDNLIELDSLGEEDSLSDGFQELGEIDALDDLDDSANSSDSFEDIDDEEKNLGHFSSEDESGDLELFGRDILLYNYLKKSLKEYYTNDLYESHFIDKVVIYDDFEVSTDMIDIIENELMMDIEMHKIELSEILCDMAIKEGLS